jgi:hypothetical protein
MIKADDLNPNQRRAFSLWRRLGLSEQSALRAMEQDGQITHETLDKPHSPKPGALFS